MKLSELKKLKELRDKRYKEKKRAYYLKRKYQKSISFKPKEIDYAKELSEDNFNKKIQEIVKKQKAHLDNRIDIIKEKIKEYYEKKKEYYQKTKEKRLEYNKKYRQEKKEKLREYYREYYRKNRDKILKKRKEGN